MANRGGPSARTNWSSGKFGNGASGGSCWVPQIAAFSALMIRKMPSVTMTTPRALRRSIGRMSVRSRAAPKMKEKMSAMGMATQ